MKILYFGTICEKEHYERIYADFRSKPSVAPFTFESALLKGFAENGAELEAVSFPVIPAFPKSKHLAWGFRKEVLESGYRTTWISTVNISGIKQLSQRFTSALLLKKWLKDNEQEEKAVLIYSAYQPVSKSIVTLCKKYHTKCYAVIPDLPRDMYRIARVNPVKKTLSRFYVRAAEQVQGKFDGYIYLTEKMKDVINPDAPYTIVEGIANVSEGGTIALEDKAPGKVIMYAGALNEKLGIGNMIQAFMRLPHQDARLWLFGSGDFEEEIKKYATKDPRIEFWGRVSRQEILRYEQQATLLVNVRNDQDEFTRYSFPSKVIEYMLSGTPMLMTKLSGIPDEYEKYTYCIYDNGIETIRAEMERICSQPSDVLMAFGEQAQQFIVSEKNSYRQVKKIMQLIVENA